MVQYNREFYYKYACEENTKNNYGVDEVNFKHVVDLIEYFGPESYRPVTRLLLANWQDLAERVEQYTPEQWELPTKIAEAYGLEKKYVAMLIEVFEGEDTYSQRELSARALTETEVKEIRERLAKENTERK